MIKIIFYNWPETGVSHDSISCTLTDDPMNFSLNPLEFALFQHTDVPLRAIGIAIGDTNFCVLTLPGKIVRIQPLDSTDMALRFAYFDKPLDLSEGDYYIGLAHVRDSLSYYGLREIPMVQELHGPPYLFVNSAIRYYQNNMWIDDTLEHILPSLFLIIEPECRMVEVVRVTTDTSGCVNVEWDSLPWQDQWVLRLAGPTGTRYDTVDTCSHTYCGLDLSEHYEVSVQSRCYPPKDSRQVSTCCMPPHRTSTSRKNWW